MANTLSTNRLEQILLGTGSRAMAHEVQSLAAEVKEGRKGSGVGQVVPTNHGLPVPSCTPPMPPVKPPGSKKAPTEAELAQARRTVENEDYLPWADVKAAKQLLGIVEPDYVAEAKGLPTSRSTPAMPQVTAPAPEQASQPVQVRVTRPGVTFDMEGAATWDPEKEMYEVRFRSPWCGWYSAKEIVQIGTPA